MPTIAAHQDVSPEVRHRRELHLNQLWEGAGTIAKAIFFFVVSPWMMHRLGAAALAEFSLALSIMACVFSFDFGIRTQLRIALSSFSGPSQQTARLVCFARGVTAYLWIFAGIIFLSLLLACGGMWATLLPFSAHPNVTMLSAVFLTGAYLLSLLLLEPLAAREQLSDVKAAAFFGNLLAIPSVLISIWLEQPVVVLTCAYFVSQIVPNLLLLAIRQSTECRVLLLCLQKVRATDISTLLADGRWIGLVNVQWLCKSYLLPFLASMLFGPVEVSALFLSLKFSELLSLFGATTSETSTAALVSNTGISHRTSRFLAMYRYTLAMCLPIFAIIVCMLPWFMSHWVKVDILGTSVGIWVGLFGLAAGFKKIVANSSLGVGLSKSLAIWGSAELGLTMVAITLLYPFLGLNALLIGSILGTVGIFPAAAAVARTIGRGSFNLWISPAWEFSLCVGLLAVTWAGHQYWLFGFGTILAAVVSLRLFRRSHAAA